MREPRFCEICGRDAETHHWVSRGSGGPREPWNEVPLCRVHHCYAHSLGRVSFAYRYPQFEARIRDACERCGRQFDKGEA